MRITTFVIALFTFVGAPLFAQHAIDVQRFAAEGDYFKALHTYDQMAKRRRTLESQIAAGNAAWALSLPERSIEELELVLQSSELTNIQRSQLLLTRGIIEFQEERYRVAVLFAERVYKQFEDPHVLRARALLLWGDALMKLESLGVAEDKYLLAIAELPRKEQHDAFYHLGLCQVRLGKLKDARESFQNLPLEHERSADAIRYLAAIALDENEYHESAFWLKRGRAAYPNQFLDSWVDYAMAKVAISENKPKTLDKIVAYAEQKYPPSDHWLTLLQAAAESYYWRASYGGPK